MYLQIVYVLQCVCVREGGDESVHVCIYVEIVYVRESVYVCIYLEILVRLCV